MQYRIGQFSLITRFSVKTLRYYHEIGLLEPSRTDPDSGYRYYDDDLIDRARLISLLRDLDVPLSTIAEIADRLSAGGSIDKILSEHSRRVDSEIIHLEQVRTDLERFRIRHSSGVAGAENPQEMTSAGDGGPRTAACDLRSVGSELVASARFVGRYEDSGPVFQAIARVLGNRIAGVPFSLYWQIDHRPEEADIETCFPVRHVIEETRLEVGHVLRCSVVPAARCMVTVHRGPYHAIGDAYSRVFRRMDTLGFEHALPIRERYLRGPGTGARSENYLTEVAVQVAG